MSISTHIAKHFKEVYFGGNSTGSNLKDQLSNVSWQQANIRINSLNTIAALVYHIGYYTAAVLNVLKGNQLDAHDKFSFDHPAINSKQDWENMLYVFKPICTFHG